MIFSQIIQTGSLSFVLYVEYINTAFNSYNEKSETPAPKMIGWEKPCSLVVFRFTFILEYQASVYTWNLCLLVTFCLRLNRWTKDIQVVKNWGRNCCRQVVRPDLRCRPWRLLGPGPQCESSLRNRGEGGDGDDLRRDHNHCQSWVGEGGAWYNPWNRLRFRRQRSWLR